MLGVCVFGCGTVREKEPLMSFDKMMASSHLRAFFWRDIVTMLHVCLKQYSPLYNILVGVVAPIISPIIFRPRGTYKL